MSADFAIRWAVILAVALIDVAWMWAKGISIDIRSLATPATLAGIFVACAVSCSMLAARRRSLEIVLRASADYLQSVTQLMIMIVPLVALTYLAAGAGRPLTDEALMRADALLGFDWRTATAWVDSHPLIAAALQHSYRSIQWQFFAVLFLASVNRPGDVNGDFIWNFLISLLLTTAIATLLPALGHGGAVGTSSMEVMHRVRGSGWTTFDLRTVDGIITFPSFHAALGVLCAYSARHQRWALCIVLPLNIAMIVSTPTQGGHYLVDTIAGCLIAWLSIVLVRRLRAWIAGLRLDRTAWAPGELQPATDGKH